jgi:hypothetical protein
MISGQPAWHPGRVLRRIVGWFYLSEADVRDVATHRWYLGICLFLTVLPVFMANSAPGHVMFFGLELPGSCMSRELFGTTCPGCGLTRSFVVLTHGQFRESLALHRLGFVLYLFFLWQIVYRCYCIHKRGAGIPLRLCRLQSYLGMGMVFALLANWGIGLFLGGN